MKKLKYINYIDSIMMYIDYNIIKWGKNEI